MLSATLLLPLFLGRVIGSTDVQPEMKAVSTAAVLGEGPHWDEEKQVLYYVDIISQEIHRYDPRTEESRKVYIDGGPVSLVIPVKFEDEFVVGRGRDIALVRWDGKSDKPSEVKVLASVDEDKPNNRFNDGKVDSSGRLWAGTMGPENPDIVPEQGSLYSFEPYNNFKPAKHLSKVSISNGIAWNKNDTLMYYVDTPTGKVEVFDFDIVSGTISNRQTLIDLTEKDVAGKPDGMTMDENDNLWVAMHGGSAVVHVDTATGELLRKIEFPVSKITSCTFGGPERDILFVTTANVRLSEAQLEEQPLAGHVFQVTGLGVKGQIKPNKIRVFSSGRGGI